MSTQTGGGPTTLCYQNMMPTLVFACRLSALPRDLRSRAQEVTQLLFHRHHLHHLLASHQLVTRVSVVVAGPQTPSSHTDTETYCGVNLTLHMCNSATKE